MTHDDGEAGRDPPLMRWLRRRTRKDWAFGVTVAAVATVWGLGQAYAFLLQLRLFR